MGQASSSRRLALVVDDDALVQNFVRAVLEGHGFEVYVADDGKTAASIYEEHSDFSRSRLGRNAAVATHKNLKRVHARGCFLHADRKIIRKFRRFGDGEIVHPGKFLFRITRTSGFVRLPWPHLRPRP